MFIDKVTIRVEGGTGGSGAEAFRRESGNPRGGPSGGDGGDGGDVVLVCDPQLGTLLDFRYRSEYKAERGAHGEGSDCTGRQGEDMTLKVPPGTVVKDAETGELIGELLGDGDRIVVGSGGRGGRGNARFATPTRQAPRYWEPGEPGESRTIELTLKLIADVGLVGKPNAGKSTLLATVSAARPKVADYPFTTLTPHLGVVELSGFRSFVVADIPGIIEGAHEGKGLGHRFLRHIERTRVLAFLIPCDDPEAQQSYDQLREEIARYSPELTRCPHCVVLSKSDLLSEGVEPPSLHAPDAWSTFVVSAVAHRGIDALLDALWEKLREERRVPPAAEREVSPRRPVGESRRAEVAEGSPEAEEAWWSQVDEEP